MKLRHYSILREEVSKNLNEKASGDLSKNCSFLIKKHRWIWTSCFSFESPNRHNCNGKSDTLTPWAEHQLLGGKAVGLFLVGELTSANAQVWAPSQAPRPVEERWFAALPLPRLLALAICLRTAYAIQSSMQHSRTCSHAAADCPPSDICYFLSGNWISLFHCLQPCHMASFSQS